MDFVTRLSISTDGKEDNYDPILVIVDRLTKIVYNKPFKVTINVVVLAEIILDVVMQYHDLSNFIMMDKSSFVTSKF